jgi:predicted nuclease of predicted toxin-antitoxin system
MKVLLDECTPRVVKRLLPEHDIATVQEVRWPGLRNGELLAAADGKYDVFITTDKNLRRQQNLMKYKLAVILLPSSSVPDVVGVISDIGAALATIQPRDFVEIPRPPK